MFVYSFTFFSFIQDSKPDKIQRTLLYQDYKNVGFHVSHDCCVGIPRVAMGLSAIGDCGIS